MSSAINILQGRKILLPVLIGFVVIGWMFYDEFDLNSFSHINFTFWTLFWLFMALIMMLTRDIGYIIRLKILSGKDLNWLQCLRIIILWEFTSAITPSAIGGTSVALYYIHKDGVSIGKSAAVVLATSFLDELYFILMFPILVFIFNAENLFSIGLETNGRIDFSNEFFYFAVIGYSIKFVFTLFVFYGLFINPHGLKKLLFKVFSFPFLRRWSKKIEHVGDEIVMASEELKQQSFIFWMKAFLSTFFSWTARYWVVNCLFLAFFIVEDHMVIFARQLIMWIMMLIMPTPGGSGFAEYVFTEFLGEFIPIAGFTAILVVLWRIITYYLYLVVGVVVLPSWIKEKYNNGDKTAN